LPCRFNIGANVQQLGEVAVFKHQSY